MHALSDGGIPVDVLMSIYDTHTHTFTTFKVDNSLSKLASLPNLLKQHQVE